MTTPDHAHFTPSPDYACGHGRTLVLIATSADEELGYSIARRHQDAAGDDITLALIKGGKGSGQITPPDPFSGQPPAAENLAQTPPSGCRRITSWGEPSGSIVYGEDLIKQISSSIDDAGYCLVYAPWPFDPDPQRATLALAAREAVRRSQHDCVLVLYRVAESDQADQQPPPPETDPLAAAPPTDMQKLAQEPAEESETDLALLPSLSSTGIAVEFSLVSPSSLTQPLAGIARHWPDGQAGDDDDQPLVSVVIRSANRPELTDALDSIALQTYPAIEVVIADVEGLARLNPGPLCGRFPIKLVSTGEHLARGTAANVGLTAASGVYAVFLDDDDWFLPDHISSLVSALQDHEGFCAAYAGIECRQRDEAGHWKFLHVFNSPHDPIRLLIQNYLPIHAVMFERGLFGPNLRFDESLHVYEDWDFWVQLSQMTDFVHIDRISAIYRISADSGFGLVTDEAPILQSLSHFFAKWRRLWTLDQVIAIARYATNHAPPVESTSAILARQSYLIAQIKSGMAHLHLDLGELKAFFPADLVTETNFRKILEQKQLELDTWHKNTLAQEKALDESKSLLVVTQDHVRHVEEALQDAESRLATTQGELRAQHERAETLERVSSHLLEKIGLIEGRLTDAETRVQAHEVRRREEFSQLYQLQQSPFWPVFTRLFQLGGAANRVADLLLGTARLIGWTLSFRLPSAWRRRTLSMRLLATGLFEPAWYLQRYPEVLFAGYRPIYHWLSLGWQQGYDPHPLFSTHWYLDQNPDVGQAGVNPLVHYLQMGGGEGRDPHPWFDSDWYLQQNPDVAQRGINPLSHFIQQGAREGRSPHPQFDLRWYLEQYPDVAASGINPLIHYVEYGQREGRIPHPSIIHGDIPGVSGALAGFQVPAQDRGGHDNVLISA